MVDIADEFDNGQLPQAPRRTSGTLSSLDGAEELSVHDSGLAMEPEQLARQFLKDATEQDNFESEAQETQDDGAALSGLALGQMISERTLDAAGQEGMEIPESEALHTRSASGMDEGDLEPAATDIDLKSSSTREDSLFDEPVDSEDDEALFAPQIAADEVDGDHTERLPAGANEEAHEQEVRRLRERLRSLER